MNGISEVHALPKPIDGSRDCCLILDHDIRFGYQLFENRDDDRSRLTEDPAQDPFELDDNTLWNEDWSRRQRLRGGSELPWLIVDEEPNEDVSIDRAHVGA